MTFLKTLSLALLIFIGSTGLPNLVFAHGAGPHGGQLVDIAPYHLEFQVAGNMLHLYVIDETGKGMVLQDKVAGKLVVQYPDGAKQETTLAPMGAEALMATLDRKDSAFVAIATITIGGKTYTARYSHSVGIAASPSASAALPGQKTVKGQLIDMSCYITHGSQGEAHKSCARDCALKGLPFGILAEDGNIYQILPKGHDDPKTVNQTLLDYLEEKVAVQGMVFEKNGARVITIDKIERGFRGT
jgi:hypothetical protein